MPARLAQKAAEETPVVEPGRRRQREKGVGRPRAHRREIGEVHRQQPTREDLGLKIRGEVDAGDLTVDGDDVRAARGRRRRRRRR